MLTKNDQNWLDLLEGKEVLNADSNTLDEVQALKIALHTELQWQKLQVKIRTKNPSTNKLFVEWMEKTLISISDFFNWKNLTLGIAYTFAVVATTLHIFVPVGMDLSPKPFLVQTDVCSSGSTVHVESDPKQEALRWKQQFESVGAETNYQKINDKLFLLEILPPESPSQELRNLWDEKSINTILSSTCSVSLLFTVLEE